MKNVKLVLIAIIAFAFSLMLASCTAAGKFMNPIVNGIVNNANDAYNLSYAKITLESDTYTYNGTAFTPAITKVEIASVEVKQENYSVSYGNNLNAGTATVSVTAVGDVYSGSKSATFTISPKQFLEVTAKVTSSYVYTGKAITPDVKDLKESGVNLTNDDYDLVYENNINVGTDKATLTVVGKENYTGSASFQFSISTLSLDGALVTLNRNTYLHTGKANTPTVSKVFVGDINYFIPSENFSITYTDNIDVGEGLATITGINNCSGLATCKFVITNQDIWEISFATVEGQSFDSIFEIAGSKIQKPVSQPIDGKENSIINWYTSSDFSLIKRFFFDEMPAKNLTLYGRWEKEIELGFFSYENATPDLSIDSFDELVNLFEYVSFSEITSKDEQEFYTMNYTYTSLEAELQKAWGTITYPTTTGYGNTYMENPNGKHSVKIYLAFEPECIFNPTIKSEASLTVQYKSLNSIEIVPTRAENFNDFYIERLTKSYQVESSNQLYYLLEHGLKPDPIAESAALQVYEQAKLVLRQIINDDMSDYDKAVAIFQWLVNNITYDYGVVNIGTNEWIKYNCFYLEGVFLDQLAVCDGISKAYVVLCQMEGIPCVRVTGYTGDDPTKNGHAWNKVKIDNQWFVVDPTWGNTATNSNANEFLSYQDFMISDDTKHSYDCTSNTYTYQGIASTGENKYYENCGFMYNETHYDFIIESQEELNILLQYCSSFGNIQDYTMNFLMILDYGDKFDDELSIAISTVTNQPTTAYIISKHDIENITLVFR